MGVRGTKHTRWVNGFATVDVLHASCTIYECKPSTPDLAWSTRRVPRGTRPDPESSNAKGSTGVVVWVSAGPVEPVGSTSLEFSTSGMLPARFMCANRVPPNVLIVLGEYYEVLGEYSEVLGEYSEVLGEYYQALQGYSVCSDKSRRKLAGGR